MERFPGNLADFTAVCKAHHTQCNVSAKICPLTRWGGEGCSQVPREGAHSWQSSIPASPSRLGSPGALGGPCWKLTSLVVGRCAAAPATTPQGPGILLTASGPRVGHPALRAGLEGRGLDRGCLQENWLVKVQS